MRISGQVSKQLVASVDVVGLDTGTLPSLLSAGPRVELPGNRSGPGVAVGVPLTVALAVWRKEHVVDSPRVDRHAAHRNLTIIQGPGDANANLLLEMYQVPDQVAVDAVCAVSYTHLRAHETRHDLVCRLLL